MKPYFLLRDLRSKSPCLVLHSLFSFLVPYHFVTNWATVDSTLDSSLWKWFIWATGERVDRKIEWPQLISCPPESLIPVLRRQAGAAVRKLVPARIRALYRNSHELRLSILSSRSAHMSYFRKSKSHLQKKICILCILIKSWNKFAVVFLLLMCSKLKHARTLGGWEEAEVSI